jgi:hypothetical protein
MICVTFGIMRGRLISGSTFDARLSTFFLWNPVLLKNSCVWQEVGKRLRICFWILSAVHQNHVPWLSHRTRTQLEIIKDLAKSPYEPLPPRNAAVCMFTLMSFHPFHD